MANKGDVDLVIRARNEASKALDTVSKALDDLDKKQSDVGSSASKAGNLLDQFAKTVGVVATAYTRLQSDADRAAQTFARQEATLTENKAAYEALAAQMEAAARVQRNMANFVGPRTKEQQQQVTLVAKAYEQLQIQAQKLNSAITRQENDLKQSFYALQEVTGGAEQAAAALAKVQQGHQQAAAAALKDAEAQTTAAEAAKRAAESTQRRTALETRRDLSGAISTAQGGQSSAQGQIKAIADEMARTGKQTSEQIAQMARLRAYAASYKMAISELGIATERFNRVLRTEGATQEEVAQAQEHAKAALAGASNLMRQTTAAIRDNTAAEEANTRAKRGGQSASGKLDDALRSLFSNSRRSLSLYQRLRGEVLALTNSYLGLYAAIGAVNKVIQATVAMQATESRINVVTGGDPAKTGQEMQWIEQQADRLGISLQTLGDEWSKFAIAAKSSNFAMADTRKIFMSVAEAGRVLHMGSDQMSLSLLALTQMMSKGKIQAQELTQQLGNEMPGSFAMMAKAVGVSTAELMKMMQNGQLTSDYLVRFADVLNETYGKQLPNSLHLTQAEIGRFETRLMLALNSIGESGVIDAFTAALRHLSEMLKSDDAQVWFQRIGAAVGGVVKLLMTVLDNMDLIFAAFAALGAAKGVAYVISLTQAIMKMITALRAAAVAGEGLSIAMAGIGGPVGIAIGLLAGAFTYLATKVGDSEKAMVSAKRATDEIVTSYQMGAQSAKQWADALQGMSNLQIDRTLGSLHQKLTDQLSNLGSQLSTTIVTDFGQVIELPVSDKVKEIQKLVDEVRNGSLPIADFKKKLDEIGKANPDLRNLVLSLQDQADQANKTDTAIRKFEASIRLMRGTASDADKSLLGVNNAMSDSADAAERAAQQMAKYQAAMDNLAKAVPGLKRALNLKTELSTIEQNFQSALKAAGNNTKLINDAKDRALQAIAAAKKAFDDATIKSMVGSHGDSLISSVNMVKGFEGFQPTAKWDVNAYRAGYGSDTVTLSDGTIQKITKGMTVSQNDALRDLVRRIGEFQTVVKDQIGSDRFSSFTSKQQAALTSIAYNYGKLPKDIVEAIKTGSNEGIAAAVRRHATDNGGVNSGRRMAEAAVLGQPSPALQALTQKDTDKQIQKEKDNLDKINKSLDDQIAKIGMTVLQQKIYNETVAKGIALNSKDGQEIAKKVTELYNAQEAEKAPKEAMSAVDKLTSLRSELQKQLKFNQKEGDLSNSNALNDQLKGVNEQLSEAIDKALQFYKAMSGPDAELAVLKLNALKTSMEQTGRVQLDVKSINQQFTSGAVSGFNSIADAMGGWIDGALSGRDAIKGMRDAFLKFAADFLRQIADMILQQVIFNLVSGGQSTGGSGGSGGLGGLIASLFHSGGVVGEGGAGRALSPGLFAGAVRYHTGGIAGLMPNEIPTILQRGEEVLTRNDPRHMMNGGRAGASGGGTRIVNVLDPSLVQDHLNSSSGEQVLINVIRRNGSSIKQILSES